MVTLNIETIAASLEGLEETIIFKLLDRAQFKLNTLAYESGQSGFTGDEGKESLFELRLLYHERMDSVFGRFFIPEERPFCSGLPVPQRRPYVNTDNLHISDYNVLNMTKEIKKVYLSFLPSLCIAGDDNQYGSSVEHDVYALQALSRRIHFGAFYVAESKYQSNPALYDSLIKNKDTQGLLESLTRKTVEDTILQRVAHKIKQVQAHSNTQIRRIIDPEDIVTIYRDYIIPLTKQGEIHYFLNREKA